MLHLWMENSGMKATSSQLESALKAIGREDVITLCMKGPNSDDDSSHVRSNVTDRFHNGDSFDQDQFKSIDSPSADRDSAIINQMDVPDVR